MSKIPQLLGPIACKETMWLASPPAQIATYPPWYSWITQRHALRDSRVMLRYLQSETSSMQHPPALPTPLVATI